MPFVIEESGIPDVTSDEVTEYHVLADLFPASSNAQQRWFDSRLTIMETPAGLVNGINATFTFTRNIARVYIDAGDVTSDESSNGTITDNVFVFDAPPPIDSVVTGYVIIPHVSFDYDEDSAGSLSSPLNVEIAKHTDRSGLLRNTSIRFETAEKLLGVWGWRTIIDTGKLRQTDYSLGISDKGPNDKFSITVASLLEQRLEASPLGLVVLHDPAKVTVNESEFISIPTIDGVDHAVTIVPTASYTTHKLFEYVAARCGFAGVRTNVPDFPLRRTDFAPGEPYFNAIAGPVGIFEPEVDVDADDFLVLREGTNDVLTDTAAARVLTVDDMTSLGDTGDVGRFKGSLMTYQDQGLGWDYYIDDVTYALAPPDGLGDLVTLTETVTRLYYRRSFPNTPIRQEVTRRTTTTTVDTFTTFSRIVENYVYDALGNLLTRTRTAKSRLPDPSDDFTFKLLDDEAETETVNYTGHPYEAESVYQSYKEIAKTGLIVTDGNNQQLGENYSQSLLNAYRSGNLTEDLTGSTGPLYNYREWQTPYPNRRVHFRTAEKDEMNRGTLPQALDEWRVGDIGISVSKQLQRLTYVLDGGDPNAVAIRPLNVGEAPLAIARPLATRLNRRQFYPGKSALTVPGIDLSLVKGRTIIPKDRDGNTFGTYRILGRRITGAEGKYFTLLTAKQIGSAETVATPSTTGDVFYIALESGQSKVISFDIPCYDDYTLSGEIVTDLVVEARHSGGSYSNIENSAIDLSPYAGSTETFQVRVTAPTVTSHYTRAFTLRVGPALAGSIVSPLYNSAEAEILNSDEDIIYVGLV